MYRSFIEIAENKLVPENLLPGIWASALQCFLFEVSTDRLGFSAEIVFTHQDAEDQLRFNPELPLFVNPFGVDADSFPARRDMPGSDLLYVGNYLHYPNRQAVMAIALEILPKVRRFSPETEFHVAGSFMRKDLEEVLAAHENIVVEGFVPSLIDTYHRAAVFVSPIFTGRGMRVKHLEVLSCGLTLITTERGMAGIDLPEGKAWLRAETAEEFVEKILWCLSNPFASIEIGKNAAELIRQRYTWEHRTKAFLSIIKRILTSRDGDEQ
jgi:glycosyltransferase involved in cell wall biosynthesis